MKKARITLFSFVFTTFFTRSPAQGLRSQRLLTAAPAKVTAQEGANRAGGPHFLAVDPPKGSWGRSRPPRHFASTFCAVASAGARILSDEMSDILYEIERRNRCPF